LHAPRGVLAVSGNHDYQAAPASLARALARAGVTLLVDQATRRGPLAIGGIADGTWPDSINRTITALDRLPGAKVMMAHYPDAVTRLPGNVHLLLAGHTHCGQIRLPWYARCRRSAGRATPVAWCATPGA
jgi:hypothetical protein